MRKKKEEPDAFLRYNNARLIQVNIALYTITFKYVNPRNGLTETKYCNFKPTQDMIVYLERMITDDLKVNILIKRLWNAKEEHLELHLVRISRNLEN